LASLVEVHDTGIADGPPEASAIMLAVDEEALDPRRQDADAEALQFAVTDIVECLVGLECFDPALREAGIGHGFSSCVLLQAGENAIAFLP